MDKTLSDGGTATDGIQILISYALWVRGVRSLSGGKVPPGRARAELVAQHLHGQASAPGMLTELLTSMAGRWSAVELRRLQLTPCARGWSTTDPPGPVLADKVNNSRANREYVRQRGISAAIPIKVDQAANRRKKGSKGDRPRTFDTHLPAAPRGGVLHQPDQTPRGAATRYDKLAVRYLATLHIVAINEWL